MSNLNELIIAELRRTDIQDINKLIKYMNREKGFFWVRSGSHDHWTNGTAPVPSSKGPNATEITRMTQNILERPRNC